MKNPEEKAREVLNAYWDGCGFPVDPVRLAQKMGIKVVEMSMPSNVSGAIFKAKGRDAVIAVEQSDSTNRKRFSCAHEIGHYVSRESCAAGEGVGEYEYVDFRGALASKGTDTEEKFANSFAAALLMPKDEVTRLTREGASNFEMAKHFGVSQEALGYRLQSLGIRR